MNKNVKISYNNISDEILDRIKDIGRIWKESDRNPNINKDFIEEWDSLIEDWCGNSNLPLFIRKSSAIRGNEFKHISGRKIITTDNSPAQWVYYNILNEEIYDISDIHELLESDELPLSFAIKKNEKHKVHYQKTLGKYSVNKLGWKLCHIENVGMNSKDKIEEIDINVLQASFKKLMKPSNMFLLPLAIGGLGEIEEFIEIQKNDEIRRSIHGK